MIALVQSRNCVDKKVIVKHLGVGQNLPAMRGSVLVSLYSCVAAMEDVHELASHGQLTDARMTVYQYDGTVHIDDALSL